MATQSEIAKHLDLSLKGARNMLEKLGLDNKALSLDEIRICYIRNLDRVSGERVGHLDIANERMKLMGAQRRKTQLETKMIRERLKGNGRTWGTDADEKTTMKDAVLENIRAMRELLALMRTPAKKCNNESCDHFPGWS